MNTLGFEKADGSSSFCKATLPILLTKPLHLSLCDNSSGLRIYITLRKYADNHQRTELGTSARDGAKQAFTGSFIHRKKLGKR